MTVIVAQYLMTQWYPRQLKYHTDPARQRPFTDPGRHERLRGAHRPADAADHDALG